MPIGCDKDLGNIPNPLQSKAHVQIIFCKFELSPISRTWLTTTQFTHYYVFSAIVVLYVSVIQNWMNLDFEPSHNLQIGEEAQRELAKCGTQASFPQRYVVVLEELRQEAKRIMNQTRVRQIPSIGTVNMHEQLSESILHHSRAIHSGWDHIYGPSISLKHGWMGE